jgi:small GTP-binding protein
MVDIEFIDSYKIILVGDSSVGKSSLLYTYINETPSEINSIKSTIAVDIGSKTTHLYGKKIKLIVWDTAGSELYDSITKLYYKGVDVVILVFDLSDESSFDSIANKWLEYVNTYSSLNVEKIIVGTKKDKIQNGNYKHDKYKKFADDNYIPYYEVSKNNYDEIDTIFLNLLEEMRRKNILKEKIGLNRHINIMIDKKKSKTKNCC